ncbi:MAG: M24 family metallopeptidase, partial [Oscillospiraceae bacterium]|nr:M24 family metallopeptidase [Oscillospiraceae bacterium]
YCSDMTRTVAVGEVSGALRDIYQTVLDAQAAMLATIRAGTRCADADAAARRVITDAGHGAHFGHAAGHGVGLEIHEAPRLAANGTEMLAAGDVVTAEPGIYVPGLGGIRIEDMVFVTAEGCENLTRTPKGLLNVMG